MKKVVQYEEIVYYPKYVWDESDIAFRNYLLSEAIKKVRDVKNITYVDDTEAIALTTNVNYKCIDAALHIARVTWYETDDRFDLDLIIDDVKDIINFLRSFNTESRISDLNELLAFLVDTREISQ